MPVEVRGFPGAQRRGTWGTHRPLAGGPVINSLKPVWPVHRDLCDERAGVLRPS